MVLLKGLSDHVSVYSNLFKRIISFTHGMTQDVQPYFNNISLEQASLAESLSMTIYKDIIRFSIKLNHVNGLPKKEIPTNITISKFGH